MVMEDFPDLSGLQVLVVDDNEDSLELITFILDQCQAQVLKARSASEAFQQLSQVRPALLISDVNMPEEDGYSLIRRVKQLTDAQGWQLPSIALTAFTGEEERSQILAAGFETYLSKPLDINNLLATINSLIGQSQRTEPGR
jgi:CheY-like chemotaxis protein